MKLTPVDQIPKMNGYHKLQELIEEFTNGDARQAPLWRRNAMKKTILEKVADNKFNAVKQLVRFIRENDKNPGGFEDLWENGFALEDELDEIILRIAHIIELEKALEEYEE